MHCTAINEDLSEDGANSAVDPHGLWKLGTTESMNGYCRFRIGRWVFIRNAIVEFD